MTAALSTAAQEPADPLSRCHLAVADGPVAATDLARRFAQGRRVEKKVEEVLRTLTLLGQAEQMDGGYILSN